MKKTLFLALLSCAAMGHAAQYSVSTAAEWQAAWDAASDGDTILAAQSIADARFLATLSDKTETVTVQGAEGVTLTQITQLPSGMRLQNIRLQNVSAGSLGPAALGSGVVVDNLSGVVGDSPIVVIGDAASGNDLLLTNLQARQGGAVNVQSGTLRLSGGSILRNNYAQEQGGAIFVGASAKLVLSTEQGESILFENNTDGAMANDIHLSSGSALSIEGVGSALIKGGISSDLSARIEKRDSGSLILGDGSAYRGELVIIGGTATIEADKDWGDTGSSVSIETAATLELSESSSLAGSVRLAGTLAARGKAHVEQAIAVASASAAVMVEAGSTLTLARGLDDAAGAGSAVLTKEGEGALQLGGNSGYSGTLKLKSGSLELLKDARLAAPLHMQGAALTIRQNATLAAPTVALDSGANVWNFVMSNASVGADRPALTLSPGVQLSAGEGATLTLNIDLRAVTSIGGADTIALLNPEALGDAETVALLRSAPITLTDASGTHSSRAVLNAATGTIDMADLQAEIVFDRPGRAAVNALNSSVGILRGFDEALRGQMPLHHAPQRGENGVQVWASALGSYETASAAWRYSGNGVAAGVTRALGCSDAAASLGLALGYLSGENTARFSGASDADAKTDQDTLLVALYGHWEFAHSSHSRSFADGTLAYGSTDNSFDSGAYNADWDDELVHASLRLCHEWRCESGLCLTPFIGLEYSRAAQDAATFRGRNADLRSQGADLSVLSLPVGLAVHSNIEAGDGKIFTPQLELLYRGDIARDTPAATMSDGYATWISEGESSGRSAFEARGTLHLQVTDSWAVWGSASLETRSGSNARRYSIGTSYAF